MPENTNGAGGIISTGTLCVVGLLRLTSKIFANDIICKGTGGDLYSLATTSEYVWHVIAKSYQNRCLYLYNFTLEESFLLFNFSFQQPESQRLCTRSPRREWPSLSPVPAPRVPPLFADATTATRVHRVRGGNGAAAARTWSLGPWCPGNSLTRGRIDQTRARLWTAITMRLEERWVSADRFGTFFCLNWYQSVWYFLLSTVS